MNRNFDFKWLKSQVTIEQILSVYGLNQRLSRKNHYFFGPCPIHQGDNPTAFRVNLARGLWHCFTKCGGGDVVDLLCRIEHCNYAQAARILNRLAQLREPTPVYGPKVIKRVDDQNFKPFTYKLPLNPKVTFLQQGKQISAETAINYEAGTSTKSLFLKNMVAVRLYDLKGNPLGYCGRRLDPPQIKKYGKWRFAKNFPKSTMLFNAHRAESLKHKGIILVECPWAAMRFAQAGIKNTVALLGTALSPTQINWIVKSPKVLLMLDGDAAGQKATEQITTTLNSYLPTIVYRLSDGLEPEDLPDQKLRAIAQKYSFF